MADATKLKIDKAELKKEIRERTVGYITAALGLVAGLAWNDAIKSIIETVYPFGQGTMWAKLIYAVLVTILIVFVTIYLMKWTKKDGAK